MHMVRDRGFPRELGQALRRAHDARLVTDHSDKVATKEEAREIVDAGELFLAAVTKAIGDDL